MPRKELCLRENLLLVSMSLILGWTVISALSLTWNIFSEIKKNQELAEKEAVAILNKDQAILLWAMSQGGTYIHLTDQNLPSFFLEHVANKNAGVTSDSGGKLLAILSPDSIVNQIIGEPNRQNGVKSRLTSLDSLNDANQPDQWERKQLEKFIQGERELSEFTDIQGLPYFRLMRGLYAENKCLKCHDRGKYKIGDPLGSVSVSLPMGPYLKLQGKAFKTLILTYGVVWLLGLLAIIFLINQMRNAIIEQERVEKQLNQVAFQLKESNHELQDFAHVVSHDLQEPLNVILALGNRLRIRHGETLSEHGRTYLEHIEKTAGRMQSLVTGLLEFASIAKQKSHFQSVNLSELAQEVLADLSIRIEETAGIVELGELCEIEADRLQMRQLLQNLIGNALKYHCPRVPPIVSVYSQTYKKGSENNNFCRLVVQDNGIGFTKIDGEKIFDIFYRLHDKRQYEGAGVGLGICKKIVQHHGGEITFESAPGEGTKFLVALPLNQLTS